MLGGLCFVMKLVCVESWLQSGRELDLFWVLLNYLFVKREWNWKSNAMFSSNQFEFYCTSCTHVVHSLIKK